MSKSNLLGRCISATGSLPAAVLLYRVCYWHQHMQVTRNGRQWIAKTAAEWQEETQLSLDQYRRGVALLREHGLIDTEQHFFAKRNVTFLRLTEKGISIRLGEQLCNSAQPELCKFAQPELCNSAQPQVQGDTYKEIPTSSCGTNGQDSKVIPGDGEKSMKVQDLLLGKGQKPAVPKKRKPSNAMKIVWMETIAELTGKFVPALTNKQIGQLGLFAKACPAGKAEQVLQQALRFWAEYATSVKSKAGIQTVPSEPHVGFLLQYVGYAVDLADSKLNPAQKAMPVLPKIPSKVQLTAKPEQEKPSLDDVMSILGKD